MVVLSLAPGGGALLASSGGMLLGGAALDDIAVLSNLQDLGVVIRAYMTVHRPPAALFGT